jgi:hypothetical protein
MFFAAAVFACCRRGAGFTEVLAAFFLAVFDFVFIGKHLFSDES